MSLHGLIRQFPQRFNDAQTWYLRETFMDTPEPNADALTPPATVFDIPTNPPGDHLAANLPTAVDLAALFLRHPELPLWERYVWTSDTDHEGQRVYVGVNHGLFEIHRHLHLTSRWAIALWQ